MSTMEFFFSSAVTTLIEKLNLSDVAFSLFCLFVFSSLVQKLTSKGPMLWPLVGIFPTMIMHCTCLHEWITKALIDHRGTVPFRGLCVGGICGIVTADPVKIEYMLKSKFHNFPKGRYYRERFTELLGQGIFNADDQSWKHQRQAAATVMHSVRFVEYSTQSMQDLVHKKLLKVLENLVESKVCIDLQELLLRFTFDNICVAAFGVDPGCLSIGLPDVPFAKAFEEATESTLCRFIVPPFVWKTLKFFDLGFERRLKNSVKVVHDFAAKTVQERKEELAQDQDINLDEKFDLLSRLINLEKGNKNDGGDSGGDGGGEGGDGGKMIVAEGCFATYTHNQLFEKSKKMSKVDVDVPAKGGFSFDLCRRNDMLMKKGLKPSSFLKTGTTIVGLIFKDGVILGADTRATEGPIVADKNCEKIHYMAPNIYCCGAGTAADTEAVTDNISSQLKLHRYHTGRESRVVTALTLLKSHLFSYQGHVSAALVLGGVDVTGPHLHTIYPHGSTDSLPFATMGSGSLAAMAVFESRYVEGMSRDDGVALVRDAIRSGIFNDLGSGSNVDICVITKGQKEYLRNYETPNPRTFTSEKGYTFSKKTEVLTAKVTPLRELVEVVEAGDAMEE
ncbi:hypothetical protein ACET3Z_025217 [Daucus carota]